MAGPSRRGCSAAAVGSLSLIGPESFGPRALAPSARRMRAPAFQSVLAVRFLGLRGSGEAALRAPGWKLGDSPAPMGGRRDTGATPLPWEVCGFDPECRDVMRREAQKACKFLELQESFSKVASRPRGERSWHDVLQRRRQCVRGGLTPTAHRLQTPTL